MSRPLRSLHVDIEGGWGGSSRSLFELVSRLDRTRVEPLVVHRQEGPLQDWYREAGIETIHLPDIASYVPRRRKALKNFIATLPRLRRLGRAARAIDELIAERGVGLVHLNYEGLFLLARRLRRAGVGVPMFCHSRAHLPLSGWGRWLVRTLDSNIDRMLFISPQEEARYRALGGTKPGEVMWNISRPVQQRRPLGNPPEAVYFGTLDWTKGTDRLIDIAAALEAQGAPPLRIAVYGKARTDAGFGQEMARRIAAEGLSDRVRLAGYTTDPMQVMAGALALIRPSRDNDPWGRDVIEASCAGLPVLATGSFDGVVRDGVTGYLFDPFDAGEVAARLDALATDETLRDNLSAAAQSRGMAVFGGTAQAEQFMRLVADIAAPARCGIISTEQT